MAQNRFDDRLLAGNLQAMRCEMGVCKQSMSRVECANSWVVDRLCGIC